MPCHARDDLFETLDVALLCLCVCHGVCVCCVPRVSVTYTYTDMTFAHTAYVYMHVRMFKDLKDTTTDTRNARRWLGLNQKKSLSLDSKIVS